MPEKVRIGRPTAEIYRLLRILAVADARDASEDGIPDLVDAPIGTIVEPELTSAASSDSAIVIRASMSYLPFEFVSGACHDDVSVFPCCSWRVSFCSVPRT